jgi:hypothetical protein
LRYDSLAELIRVFTSALIWIRFSCKWIKMFLMYWFILLSVERTFSLLVYNTVQRTHSIEKLNSINKDNQFDYYNLFLFSLFVFVHLCFLFVFVRLYLMNCKEIVQ